MSCKLCSKSHDRPHRPEIYESTINLPRAAKFPNILALAHLSHIRAHFMTYTCLSAIPKALSRLLSEPDIVQRCLIQSQRLPCRMKMKNQNAQARCFKYSDYRLLRTGPLTGALTFLSMAPWQCFWVNTVNFHFIPSSILFFELHYEPWRSFIKLLMPGTDHSYTYYLAIRP